MSLSRLHFRGELIREAPLRNKEPVNTVKEVEPVKHGFNPVVRNKSEFLHNLREDVVVTTIRRKEIPNAR